MFIEPRIPIEYFTSPQLAGLPSTRVFLHVECNNTDSLQCTRSWTSLGVLALGTALKYRSQQGCVNRTILISGKVCSFCEEQKKQQSLYCGILSFFFLSPLYISQIVFLFVFLQKDKISNSSSSESKNLSRRSASEESGVRFNTSGLDRWSGS